MNRLDQDPQNVAFEMSHSPSTERHNPTDATLVERIRRGDAEAITMLYDRYADPIHGFCHGLLRDGSDAADATQNTFMVAVDRIDQLRNPEQVRPWLYSIARRHALATFRNRSRSAPMEDLTTLPDETAAPAGDDLHSAELVDLVWDAAGGLEDRDQVVLDLALRHDLGGDGLAEALGVERDHAYTLVARAKKRLGRAVGALMVARHGRKDCDTLAGMLRSWDGRLTAGLRDSINKHVDRCEECGVRRNRLTEPAALFSAIPLVVAPVAMRSDVLAAIGGDLGTVAASSSTASAVAGSGGAASGAGIASTPFAKLGIAAAAVLLAGGVGFVTVATLADGGGATGIAGAAVEETGLDLADTPVVVSSPSSDSLPTSTVPASNASTSTPAEPVEALWAGCAEVMEGVQSIPLLPDRPAPAEVQFQQTQLLEFLRSLDARGDLPPSVRSAVEYRLPLQEQYAAAVEGQGWLLLGGEPGHDATSGGALLAALSEVCA